MKQVRLFVSAAALLISGLLFADQQGTWVRAHTSHGNHHLNGNFRSHASLAIDTYGYFDIRVWIDGVMINRRPQAYVEIPSLRSGFRWVEIEVFDRRGSYFVSHEMFLEPRRWNLFEVQRHPHRNWIAINSLYTKPMGYYYVGGRRNSVNINVHRNVNRPVWRKSYGIGSPQHKQNNGRVHQQSNGQQREGRQVEQRGGRSNNRGGVHQQNNQGDSRQPRGRGSRSGG